MLSSAVLVWELVFILIPSSVTFFGNFHMRSDVDIKFVALFFLLNSVSLSLCHLLACVLYSDLWVLTFCFFFFFLVL